MGHLELAAMLPRIDVARPTHVNREFIFLATSACSSKTVTSSVYDTLTGRHEIEPYYVITIGSENARTTAKVYGGDGP